MLTLLSSSLHELPPYMLVYLSKQLGYSPKLQTVKIKGKAANETPMPFIGYFSAVLKSKHPQYVDKIYVLQKDMQDPPLLSKNCSPQIRLYKNFVSRLSKFKHLSY